MRQGRQKKETTSLRTPQPKKLGLSVPPLLRLPHEELIRPQETADETPRAQKSSDFHSSTDNREEAVEISQAESARLADLDPPKIASLAKNGDLALQNTSLANSARQANSARLPVERALVRLMDALPESAGFTKLHHQIVDHLYSQLSAKEQIVHLQLYRLAWGTGRPNCFISLPKLARRSNLSQRSTAEATALLESKGLIRKAAVVTGKGKDQGIEYWITPAPALAKTASLANPASHAPIARHAESERGIEYKEELHEEHTHKEACVGVSSRFTLAECRQFADHLQRTGQGITNPGGYATAIHRTGEADGLIETFLNPPPSRDLSKCPDCKGQGYRLATRGGREGVVKCQHDRLEQVESSD
jgi:Helix-turn-helix domain